MSIIIPNCGLTFNKPSWNRFAGARGAWVAVSNDGEHEAIAEPTGAGLHCCIVRAVDGEIVAEQIVAHPVKGAA